MSKRYMLLAALRVGLGVIFFYAGITKVLDSGWSAAGFLKNAQTFPEFYAWLASPSILPLTNFLNEWGLTLVGLALILGLFTRLAAYAGAAMMILYYFPTLDFPKAGDHSFIIDDHIVYAVALLLLAKFHAGKYWGLDAKREGLRIKN